MIACPTLLVQPLHVIADPFFQREARLVTERAARVRQIGLREVLIMRVRVIDVIWSKICAEAFVENIYQFVKRTRLAGPKIINAAGLRIERPGAAFDRILHINKITLLLAMFENALPLTRFHLLREMITHARGHALVRFAPPVNVEVTQADDEPVWVLLGAAHGDVDGPREAHKGVPASMVYHLAQQMKSGQRPRIFKRGEQKRDFVYVKDAVEGSIRSLDAHTSGIYNLGTGEARSFNELVDVLNKCLGTSFQPDYIDNPHAHYQNFTQADLTNARSALGYESRFALEDGVRDYMQWLYPA